MTVSLSSISVSTNKRGYQAAKQDAEKGICFQGDIGYGIAREDRCPQSSSKKGGR